MKKIREIINMKHFDKIFYVAIVLLSIAFLFFGNMVASRNLLLDEQGESNVFSARVRGPVDVRNLAEEWGWDVIRFQSTFYADITSGDRRGERVFVTQDIFNEFHQQVETGDRILLRYNHWQSTFNYHSHARINYIIVLGILFFIALVAFARLKGFNAIISLGFVCIAIFTVLIPAILSGMDIYAASIIISVYAIVSTLFIVIGFNKKAICAIIGCLGGVILAAGLMFIMDGIMGLTGFADHDTLYLLDLPFVINLRGILFAGVIIGSTGAIMDVAMSISSSLWEVHEARTKSSFKDIFKSGVEIGKDVLGTMLNTLILAYIGSSLALIILLNNSATSMTQLFNMEMIVTEFLRALVGGFGMFLAVPLTAAVCGWLYIRGSGDNKQEHKTK